MMMGLIPIHYSGPWGIHANAGVGKAWEGDRIGVQEFTRWTDDLDRVKVGLSQGDGPDVELATKGRCLKCWGGLIAHGEAENWTKVECRVCGSSLEGSAAVKERDRMTEEQASNLFRMNYGFASQYRQGAFTYKLDPTLEPLSREAALERIDERQANLSRRGVVTRADIPLGSAGWFVMQAKTLLAGVDPSIHESSSVPDFPPVEVLEDGALRIRHPANDPRDTAAIRDEIIKRRMGTTLMAALASAFACELTMKAIAITTRDEADKTHDLASLYKSLPDMSRRRVETDYPNIGQVLEHKRHTFGGWRYFEKKVGKQAIASMIDGQAACDLSKSARVLLDEAEIMGLQGGFSLKATRNSRRVEEQVLHRDTIKLRLDGSENPPDLE